MKKHGGIWFMRVWRIRVSFCITRASKDLHSAPAGVGIDREQTHPYIYKL